ncbi:MAG: TIGR02206 family membrane protein [Verrucomicrobiota bacterium]
MTQPFHPFTQEHFLTLGIGMAVTASFLFAGKRNERSERLARALLAFLCLSAFGFSQIAWMLVELPKTIDNIVPLHMCDIAAITAGFALITGRRLLCSITYFWGLAATLQALLTPAITVGFPAPPFIMFFVHHFAVVIAALYLPIVSGWRPQRPLWRGPLEIFGISVLYLGVVLVVNHFTGSNFAFVSHPPSNPSLIDHLGPWPWYIGSLLGLALILYFLLVLPFAFTDRRTKS